VLMTALLSCFFALVVFQLGCGSSSKTSTTTGTPAGTYNLTVTATSGSASRDSADCAGSAVGVWVRPQNEEPRVPHSSRVLCDQGGDFGQSRGIIWEPKTRPSRAWMGTLQLCLNMPQWRRCGALARNIDHRSRNRRREQ
jgi:hypothetical protein